MCANRQAGPRGQSRMRRLLPSRAPALVALLSLSTSLARAEAAEQGDAQPLSLELPVLDAPRAFDHGGRFPTWDQAMAITRAVYSGGHLLIDDLTRPMAPRPRAVVTAVLTVAFDVAL